MDTLVLKSYYEENGISEEETEKAIHVLTVFNTYVLNQGKTMENCSVNLMKQYISVLTENKKNDLKSLLALARSSYLAENREVYIYFTQIIERENVITNMQNNIESTIGKERANSIYDTLTPPITGAPPERAYFYTKKLVETLEEKLSESECRKALTANAHGIPAEAFQQEADFFQKSPDLKTYLEDFHNRSVETLQNHADSGKVWFEQIISQPVVDYVRENKEVLGGVLENGKILWTKIPYDTEKWLLEKDPAKKRYYACHCPMAREILNESEEKMPRAWCNCTSGYIQQRFNAILGQEVQVDLLESVLDNQDRCRFAIHVPPKYL